ncbi:MAG: FAD-binding protein [Magnetovibrio sp.]|nr:FAD-binding protein [Magnetovibrio sp.]
MTVEIEWRDYDVVVVGSGGAGGAAAGAAAEAGARVLVVSKDPIGCSDTKISEGNATVRASSNDADTVQELSENLRVSGADLPVPAITNAYAEDSRRAYDWYRAHGLRPKINTERQGPFARPIAKGGHTFGRSVGHANAGVAWGHASWEAIIEAPGIAYLEDAWFLDLVIVGEGTEKRVAGGLVYDAAGGQLVAVRAPAVIIAAGGLSTLFFPKTDTMRGNTGDGYAVAARAGAELVDMEQVQFLPFCLTSPPSYEGLLAGEPTTASFLGVLRDRHGKVILDGVFLRTRAECSAAIMRAVADGRGSPNGGAYLDLTANVAPPKSGAYYLQYIRSQLPTGYVNARQAMGKKAVACEEPWEVRPAAHYMMGGIRVDADGASAGGAGDGARGAGLAGLFAAGQAMGGVFGANRLGSTALTENVVFGLRAGRAAAALARDLEAPAADTDAAFDAALAAARARFGQPGGKAAALMKRELQEAAWACIGPARTLESLARMDALIDELGAELDNVAVPGYGLWNQAFIELEELRNLLDVARLVTAAARERDASVGGHVRLDRPNVSVLAKPYSTVARRAPETGALSIRREARAPTPLARLVAFRAREAWRRAQLKMLRWLPTGVLDDLLVKRYRTILGPAGAAPEVQPGSPEAAAAEAGGS